MEMQEPTLEQLEKIRETGFRPGVVACILNTKKLLMFYKKEHKLWQLPQGGINSGESPLDALKREIIEELGNTILSGLDFSNVPYLLNDRMEFKPGRHSIGTVETITGKEITMVGKEYFFYSIQSGTSEVVISETQFDEYFWVSYKEGYFLADRMYQKGKKRITQKVLNKLSELKLID